MNSWRILIGDVREQLSTLPAGSVRTCVTSPPYWGLRDYGVSGQLGLERTPEAYCAAMVSVFAEVGRVLADDGTLWLNLGDRYESRELVGIPWMVAFALRADGWYLRSDIIWSKPNPMPESVTDRPTKAHEYIFLLSKSRSYYYDGCAIREPHKDASIDRAARGFVTEATKYRKVRPNTSVGNMRNGSNPLHNDGANKRSVWNIATQPYPDAHFATFPEDLIEPCILAGSAHGDTVLDPFTGSGTTGAVAIRHQRNFIGCELNPAYVELARKRIGSVAPLLSREVA